MVGLGETDAEVTTLMSDLAAVGCDMLTIGQYLAPGRKKRFLARPAVCHAARI